jgi:peptidyl-prolyl cis-trans isomerase D
MLQSIRDRLTGPLVWFVVGLIAIPFAFWGIDSFNTGGGDPVMAEVGDQKITQNEFSRAYEQRYQQYRSLLGENFRADLFDENQFRRLTLDDMVQESALRQFARASGYRASDAVLRDYLVSIPAFQKDGRFSAETYRELLQRQNLPVDRYEAQLRESLVIDQLRGAVQDTSFATEQDVWTAFRLQNQTREVAVATVGAEAFRAQIEPDEARIAEYFDANRDRFRAPERVRVRYVELDRNRLPPVEDPAPELLRSIYDAEKDARFVTAEERKASHVLINFGADSEAARAEAESVLAKLRGGAVFAEIAEQESDDPGSREQGGDLGWVRKGMMVPAFEQALFGTAEGELVGPVETEFGWHVIRVDEIRAQSVRAFEDADVQAELLEVYRNRESEERFQELSATLDQTAFENTTLEPVAEAVGLEIQTSDWFTRSGGAGIAASREVQVAAFSPEVLDAGENSRPLANGPDALVVLHKESYEPARQRTIDEVRDQVRDALIAEAAIERAREVAAQVADAVRAGTALSEALEPHGLEIDFDGIAARGQAELDQRVAEQVFAMPRPAASSVQVEVLSDTRADPVVVVLRAVNDMKQDVVEAEVLEQERRTVRESLAGSEFAGYREAVEEAVSVEIHRSPDTPAEDPLQP